MLVHPPAHWHFQIERGGGGEAPPEPPGTTSPHYFGPADHARARVCGSARLQMRRAGCAGWRTEHPTDDGEDSRGAADHAPFMGLGGDVAGSV
jgi:hypothetical protein